MDRIAAASLTGIWYVLSASASGIAGLFATSPPPPLTMEETIRRLEAVQQNVARREEELRAKIREHHDRAREFAQTPGRKRDAMVQIRLELLYDTQLQNTHRTQTAIASHLLSIEAAVLNRQVLSALSDGSRALGHRRDDEDSVEDLMDELEDQHACTNALLEIIQERPPDAGAVDEEDMEREFAALLEESGEVAAASDRCASPIILPIPPDTPLPMPPPPPSLEEGDGERATL